jgi:1,4-dihydroxy-2-naphthoate octaprenyltransferase
MTEEIAHQGSVKAWLTAFRLPFTTVAVVPFVVGGYLAYKHGSLVSVAGAILGTLAVFLIVVGCYLLGEVFDQKEDILTRKYGRSKFAGGTLVVAGGALSARAVQWVAGFAFGIAAILGVIILVIHGSFLLFGLGTFGALSAALYSLPPVRLVKRGLGELFIGLCYGWLTVVTGYACASGTLPQYSYFFCLPIAFTVFNIILINEFHDYEADRETGKRNLLNRAGKPLGAVIYSFSSFLTAVVLMVIWSVFRRGSLLHLALAVPASGLALALVVQVLFLGRWRDRKTLEPICGQTIVLNHLCSLTIGMLVVWQ